MWILPTALDLQAAAKEIDCSCFGTGCCTLPFTAPIVGVHAVDIRAGVGVPGGDRADVTVAAVVAIFEHIVAPRMDGEQNVFSLSAFGDDTST